MLDKLIDLRVKGKELGYGEGSCGSEKRERLRKLLTDNPQIERIGEIGFNVGMSAYTFLSTSEKVVIDSFDIGRWEYTLKAFDLLVEQFGDRINLFIGNSLEVVPQYPGKKFDLIFVDGGHSFEVAYGDIENMKQHAHNDTMLLIDDYGLEYSFSVEVTEAVDQHVAEGNIIGQPDQEIKDFWIGKYV